LGDFFFAARVSEIDAALFDPLQDRADGVWPSECHRHIRPDLLTQPLEERRLLGGEDDLHGAVVRLGSGRATGGENFHDTDPL